MHRSLSVVGSLFLLSVLLALPAWAHPRRISSGDNSGAAERTAVGFHTVAAPLGVRTHLYDNVGLDLAVGFKSKDSQDDWAFDGGLPIEVKRWPGVRVLVRPGVFYHKEDLGKQDRKTTTVSAELEGEAFFVRNFSVSASLGVAHDRVECGNSEETAWRSTGGGYSDVGFHLYLWR